MKTKITTTRILVALLGLLLGLPCCYFSMAWPTAVGEAATDFNSRCYKAAANIGDAVLDVRTVDAFIRSGSKLGVRLSVSPDLVEVRDGFLIDKRKGIWGFPLFLFCVLAMGAVIAAAFPFWGDGRRGSAV